MHKFVELMSSQRKIVIIKLAACVHIGMQREHFNIIYLYCSPSLARIILIEYFHTYIAHRPMVNAE